VPGGEQLLDQSRVHHRAALGDPLHRLDELPYLRHPAFQQVADPLAGGEELGRLIDLDVRRQQQDPDRGELPPDHLGGVQPLGLIRRRHPDVDDGDVGPVLAHRGDQFLPVTRLRDDLEPRPFQETREPRAEQHVVFGQGDPRLWFDHHSPPHVE